MLQLDRFYAQYQVSLILITFDEQMLEQPDFMSAFISSSPDIKEMSGID